MDVRKILYKRSLKLLTLLLTSMLIATGSAAVYYSMLMKPTITVAAAKVQFTAGGDSSGVFNPGTNNTFCTLSLNAYPNVTLTYEQAVNLTASAVAQVQLRHVSISPGDGDPSVSNFTSIVFTLLDADGTPMGTLPYNTTNDDWNEPTVTGYQSMLANDVWTIKVEIKAAAGANIVSTTITIAVDVK